MVRDLRRPDCTPTLMVTGYPHSVTGSTESADAACALWPDSGRARMPPFTPAYSAVVTMSAAAAGSRGRKPRALANRAEQGSAGSPGVCVPPESAGGTSSRLRETESTARAEMQSGAGATERALCQGGWMEPIEINAGAWYLRALRADERIDDRPALLEGGITDPEYVSRRTAQWADESKFSWAVCDPVSAELVAEIVVTPEPVGSAHITGWSRPSQGAALEAGLGAVHRFVEGALGLRLESTGGPAS